MANEANYLVLKASTGKRKSFKSYRVTLGSSGSCYFFMSLNEERGRAFFVLWNFHLKASSSLRLSLYMFSALRRR